MKTKIISLTLSTLIFLQTMPAWGASPAAQYAETAHKAYAQRNFLKSGEYYEKAYSSEKNKIFIDNAITSYLSHAFDLANDKKYDDAIKYCLKVLSLRSTDQNAKELLSDIYYSRGYDNFFNGNNEKAKEDFESSLKYSALPEQAQKAREGLSNIKNQEKSGMIKPVQASAPNSITEIIKLLEIKIYGKNQDNLPVAERVKKLEKDVFNQNYSDESLSLRIDRLRKAVLPELAQKPINSFQQEPDYIQDIIEQSGGTAKIFGNMPILVYIDAAEAKTYKKHYKDAVKEAMTEWENASDGKIKFKISNDPMRAHLKVVWIDYFEDFAWQPELKKEDIAAQKQKIKYGKASSIVQIGSIAAMVLGGLTGVPVVGMLGSVGGSVASPLLHYKSLDLDDKILKVKINTDCTKEMSKEQSTEKIKQIAMHQLGHAIGIYGHSPDPKDIMYSNFSVNKLSNRDKNTIKEIYKNVKPDTK